MAEEHGCERGLEENDGEAMMTRAVWTNGKRSITGAWAYQWASNKFLIELDSVDRVTGRIRRFELVGDERPEWGNWRLASRAAENATPVREEVGHE